MAFLEGAARQYQGVWPLQLRLAGQRAGIELNGKRYLSRPVRAQAQGDDIVWIGGESFAAEIRPAHGEFHLGQTVFQIE